MRELSEQDIRFNDAKERWAGLGDIVLDFDERIRKYVAALSNEELADLRADAPLFSTSNCGWYEYQAMHIAAAEARVAQRQRGTGGGHGMTDPTPTHHP